ncbi:MAG: hypothetical protein ABIO35_12230 [Nitrobacter sp.]
MFDAMVALRMAAGRGAVCDGSSLSFKTAIVKLDIRMRLDSNWTSADRAVSSGRRESDVIAQRNASGDFR